MKNKIFILIFLISSCHDNTGNIKDQSKGKTKTAVDDSIAIKAKLPADITTRSGTIISFIPYKDKFRIECRSQNFNRIFEKEFKCFPLSGNWYCENIPHFIEETTDQILFEYPTTIEVPSNYWATSECLSFPKNNKDTVKVINNFIFRYDKYLFTQNDNGHEILILNFYDNTNQIISLPFDAAYLKEYTSKNVKIENHKLVMKIITIKNKNYKEYRDTLIQRYSLEI